MAANSAHLRIGTAGWSLGPAVAGQFPAEGTSLERYAVLFSCAEINSSFHRSHRAATWQRWAASVPDHFRFSAKLSKEVTHKRKLVDCEALVDAAIAEMELLGDKLRIVLVQLPPSLAFDPALAERFFDTLRERWAGDVACEPRHPSWFGQEADTLLADRRIARVTADPARVEQASAPGGWMDLVYYRLHGSPAMYRSSYDDGRLEAYAEALTAHRDAGREAWCIFDNTASSAAIGDAVKLASLV